MKERRPVKTEEDKKQFTKFKNDFIDSTKDQIIDMVLSRIQHNWVQPHIQMIVHNALRCVGRSMLVKTKSILKSFNNSENINQLKDYSKRQHKTSEEDPAEVNGGKLDPNTPITNMGGCTVKELKSYYEDSCDIKFYMDEKGQAMAHIPTYEEHLLAMGNGKTASQIDLIATANYRNQPIEITYIDAATGEKRVKTVILLMPLANVTCHH